MSRSVLVVAPEHEMVEGLSCAVAAAGFAMVTASPAEASSQLVVLLPAVVIVYCDNDTGFLRELLHSDRLENVAEVLLVGHSDHPGLLEVLDEWLIRRRAFFLGRPLNIEFLKELLLDLRGKLDRARSPAQYESELDHSLDQFGLLNGSSEPMRRIYRLLRKVAPMDTAVLVTGESGTGKELAAETLHAISARSEGPFLAINCGAIPAELVESELFGHEKGSFSGALRMHRGIFERADGGTLFLDEISEMPVGMQVRLLRVLETGRFRRVGGEEELVSDVRVVAATNRSPEKALTSGKLRLDLYFRLAQFVIRMPALRERGDDVIGLARAFLTRLNAENRTVCTMGREVELALMQADWPGNVRELKSAVERAYLLADAEIRLSDLPDLNVGSLIGTEDNCIRVSVGSSLDDTERQLIFATLHATNGNKPEAAEVLGISLKTLYNRLNHYAGESQPADGGC